MIDLKAVKDWIVFAALLIGWIVAASIGWQKLLHKINGLGGRVDKVEGACSNAEGRMDRIERELAEHRRDTQDAIGRMSRVEKGVEDVTHEIQNNHLALGTQLHNLEKLISDQHLRNTNRLVRMETLARVEDKLGPMPTD